MLENVLKTTASRVESEKYVITHTIESIYINEDIAKEITILTGMNTTLDAEIARLTAERDKNAAKIVEYQNILKLLPEIKPVLIKEEML